MIPKTVRVRLKFAHPPQQYPSDMFIVIVALTALSLGWAMARIFLTLRPRRLMKHASSREQNIVTLDDR